MKAVKIAILIDWKIDRPNKKTASRERELTTIGTMRRIVNGPIPEAESNTAAKYSPKGGYANGMFS